jgi:hypothetical protein
MTPTLRTLIAGAALLAPALAHTALAEPMYPRLVGGGENAVIEYGPGPRGNIVGGGRVVVTGGGEHTRVDHLDSRYAQAPRPGLVPVTVGSNENVSVVWVPADTSPTRLAMIGPDGSLPAEATQGGGLLARLLGGTRTRG